MCPSKAFSGYSGTHTQCCLSENFQSKFRNESAALLREAEGVLPVPKLFAKRMAEAIHRLSKCRGSIAGELT